MNKRVIITNGSGGSGKDTFAKKLGDLCAVTKYSSIDAIKELAAVGGWDGGKEEKDRKFLSDLKILFTEYNDMPFNDISQVVEDFNNGLYDSELLLIDIREPDEIERAKKAFNAVTVLVTNKNIKHITTNMADANVLNYEYDYVIHNDGTIDDLHDMTVAFYTWICNQ